MGDINNVSELSVADDFKYDPDTGDVYSVAWVDYSATSTITGFSEYETKEIYYKKIGNLVWCTYYLRGTSNSANVTFTLPYASKSTYYMLGCSSNLDGGTMYMGIITCLGDGTVEVKRQFNNGEFTDSGTKDVRGSFFFESTAIVPS